MSEEIASLVLRISSLEADVAEKRLDKLGNTSKKTEKASDGLTSSFKSLAVQAAAVAASVITIRSAIGTIVEFEKLNASLKTVTGSLYGAEIAMDMITELAGETPFSVQQLTESFIKLKAMGLDPSEAALVSYGNTASAMGKDLNQMIEAVADAATGEFERLKEFGIRASSEGDRVKFTFQGVTTEVGKNSEEIQDYLLEIGNTQFAGAMAEQVDTLGGMFSNLGDETDKLMVALGDAGLTKVTKGLTGALINLVSTATRLAKVYGEFEEDPFSDQVVAIRDYREEMTKLLVAYGARQRLLEGAVAGGAPSQTVSILRDNVSNMLAEIDEFQRAINILEGNLQARRDEAAGIDVGGDSGEGNDAEEKRRKEEIQAEIDHYNALIEANNQYRENISQKGREEIERIAAFDLTEKEREIARYESKNELLAQYFEQEKTSKEEQYAILEALKYEHEGRIASIESDAIDARLGRVLWGYDQILAFGDAYRENDKMGMLRNGVQILAIAGKQSKKMFDMYKTAAISEALISAYLGISKTLATYPFPLSAAMAAAQGVLAFAQVSSIKSQSFGGGGGSPSIGGGAVPSMQSQPSLPQTQYGSQQPSQISVIVLGGGGQQIDMDSIMQQISTAVDEEDRELFSVDSRFAQNIIGAARQ